MDPRLDIVGLPLSPSVRHKLQCAGFRTTAELAGVAGPVELATGVETSFRQMKMAIGEGSCLWALPLPPLLPPLLPPPPLCCQRCCTRHHLEPASHPLVAEAQLTHEEALLVLKLAAPQRVGPAGQPGGGGGQAGPGAAAATAAVSARQILEREESATRIITFAAELDAVLGRGVETGAITEFW